MVVLVHELVINHYINGWHFYYDDLELAPFTTTYQYFAVYSLIVLQKARDMSLTNL